MSRKVLVFSDLHANFHAAFSIPDPIYITNRFRHIIEILDQIEVYALSNNITQIVDIGDLTHQRSKIDVAVFNMIRDRLKSMTDKGLQLTLLAGNHDQQNRAGTITSIHTFDSFATVIEKFTIQDSIAYIPFSEYKEEIVEQFSICRDKKVKHVFAHIPVAGSLLREGYVSTSKYEVAISEIEPSAFIGIYMGHYHTHQFLADNMLYVGNPLHRDKADIGQQKYFIEIDLGDTFSVKPIKTHYPSFISLVIDNKLKLLQFLKEYNETDFYLVSLASDLSIPQDLWNVSVKRLPVQKVVEPRIKGLINLEPREVLSQYVTYKKIDESSYTYGKEVLEQVLQGDN